MNRRIFLACGALGFALACTNLAIANCVSGGGQDPSSPVSQCSAELSNGTTATVRCTGSTCRDGSTTFSCCKKYNAQGDVVGVGCFCAPCLECLPAIDP